MKKQLSAMAGIQDISGYFLIDDHDGDYHFCWQICENKIMESEQQSIMFNK
ncbi:hypothetical protein D3C73_1608320 [compost metagenome]